MACFLSDNNDLNALLYIVVTLLFYSMGIIIGIITYLKREQAEMEEDKMFDMYMQLKREPFNLYKKERVQQMALYLKQLEEKQAAREKIENWRTMEHNQHFQFQSCRRHNQRHSSCPDCKKASQIPEICHSFNGGATLGIPESVWGESRGSTALLCSLTLGMCEPLLTPESMKRVAFPDMTSLEIKSSNKSAQALTLTGSCPAGPSKGVFKRSSLSVHYSDNIIIMPREKRSDQIPGIEVKQHFTKAKSLETDLDSPTMFDKGDIELKKLRQFDYNEIRAVFQNSSLTQEQSRNVCDNTFDNIHTIPSPNNQRTSSTPTSGKLPAVFRQLNHDPEFKGSDLSIHAPIGNKAKDPTCIDRQSKYIQEQATGDGFLASTRAEEGTALKEEEAVRKLPCDSSTSDVCDDIHRPQQNQPEESQSFQVQEHQPDIPQPDIPQPNTPQPDITQTDIPVKTSPIILPQAIAWYPSGKYELPLKLFVLPHQQQHQLQQSADVRPKIFPVISDIPNSTFRDEAIALCASSPVTTSPQITQHLESQLPNTRKKSSCQKVDISDVTRARKLGLNWKNKTAEKKTGPRAQPERRGALFFTQRSLQKDLDSPKSSGTRKHSRPAVFGRQESVDSHISRTSDASEGLDSPLLQPTGSDTGSVVNPSSPTSSVGSSSVSPSTKHSRGIPSLVRSQTEDTSKLLQQ